MHSNAVFTVARHGEELPNQKQTSRKKIAGNTALWVGNAKNGFYLSFLCAHIYLDDTRKSVPSFLFFKNNKKEGQKMTPSKLFVTINQAAREGYLPGNALRRLVAEEKIPFLKSGNRVYIARSVLESLGGENNEYYSKH